DGRHQQARGRRLALPRALLLRRGSLLLRRRRLLLRCRCWLRRCRRSFADRLSHLRRRLLQHELVALADERFAFALWQRALVLHADPEVTREVLRGLDAFELRHGVEVVLGAFAAEAGPAFEGEDG